MSASTEIRASLGVILRTTQDDVANVTQSVNATVPPQIARKNGNGAAATTLHTETPSSNANGQSAGIALSSGNAGGIAVQRARHPQLTIAGARIRAGSDARS